MTLRRTLAAALSVGALVLAAGCAGDDVADDDDSNSDGGGGGGAVTLASQSFDEAALVTAMYAALLEDAGYDVETKLVDTRPAYLAEFPGSVDIVPEYVAGLGDQLNIDINGEDAKPVSTSDLDETLTAMQPLLDEKGITLLDAVRRGLAERLLRHPGVLRDQRRHQALRPRGRVDQAAPPLRTAPAATTA